MTGMELVYFAVKGPLANQWPVILFPLLAAAACELAARRLPATRADWRAAGALAAAPGLLFLALGTFMLWRIATHSHWMSDAAHIFKYQGTAAVILAILIRASWRARQRSNALEALIALARAPSERLAAAGRRVGIDAYLLPLRDRECFVAGFRRPKVYMSAGALDCLSDAELDAALRHEKSHVTGRDTAVLSALGFLSDLTLSGRTALTAYLQSRERIADERAAGSAGPVALASALLALARGPTQPLPAIGIAGTVAPAWRLKAILDCEDPQDHRTAILPVASSLAFSAIFVAWPSAQAYIIDHFCACHL